MGNKGWFNESMNHAKARRGIKVRNQSGGRGVANESVIKKKLSNNIQKNITHLDRRLRAIANAKSEAKMQEKLEEAKILYARLGTKLKAHKQKYGDFPEWISQDWVHKEQFSKNGKVYNLINKLESASPDQKKKLQNQLWNNIRFPTERSR